MSRFIRVLANQGLDNDEIGCGECCPTDEGGELDSCPSTVAIGIECCGAQTLKKQFEAIAG